MSTKIFFFGNEQLAQGVKVRSCPVFSALATDPRYRLSALILPVKPTRRPFPIEKLAQTHRVPIFYGLTTDTLLQLIAREQPAVGILCAYGKLIPERVINAFPCGIINLHPSLLPRYRGTTPIETALLNGDRTTGVSVMRLVKAMDAGPLCAQATVNINWENVIPTKNTTNAPKTQTTQAQTIPTKTDNPQTQTAPKTEQITVPADKQILFETLGALGAKLILQVLPAILQKNALETPQNDREATFTTKLDKTLAELKPRAKDAQTLAREVVAYAGFPKSKYRFHAKNCTVTQAHVAPKTEQTALSLVCRDGNLLVVDQLIPENSRAMSARAFLNGLRKN